MTRLLPGMLLFAAAFGQSPLPSAFEIASINPIEDLRGRALYDFSSSGPRVRYRGYAVRLLVMEAYNVKNYRVTFAKTAAPTGLVYDAFYDIEAKAEGDGARTRNEFRPMLQALLADRFKLKVHREMREMPVYALVVGKDGPKFKESAPDAVERHLGDVNGRNQIIAASKMTMDQLAQMISDMFVERPVVNRTGLVGTYDLRMEATPESRMTRDDPDLKNISVFSAIQQQLGLKLEPQKAMVEGLVVDHVERPSAN